MDAGSLSLSLLHYLHCQWRSSTILSICPVPFPFVSSTHAAPLSLLLLPLASRRRLWCENHEAKKEFHSCMFVSKTSSPSLPLSFARAPLSLSVLIAFLLPATFSKWFHMTGSPFFLIHSTSGDEIMRAEGTGTPVSTYTTYMDARYSRGASKRQCTHISTLPSDMSKLLPAGVLSRAKLLKEFGSCNICYGLHFIDVAVGWTDTLGGEEDGLWITLWIVALRHGKGSSIFPSSSSNSLMISLRTILV